MVGSIQRFTKDHHAFFSVLILCWNSELYLSTCLESLRAQTIQNFEVILVDNGSSVPVDQAICAEFPELNIFFCRLEQNLGFAGGNNIAAKHARGTYLVLLNADAFPRPNWLEEVQQAVSKYPGCSFASKLIMANDPEKLDGEGDVYHFTGLAWRKSHGKTSGSVKSREGEVFSPCGAAAIYPKEAFEQVGGFDPDYFAYVEDVDLGFRLRLAGFPCIYLPAAELLHVGSGSTGVRSDFATYYGHRNLIWTFFKNMPTGPLIGLALFHLLMNVLLILYGLFSRRGATIARAKLDAIRNLPVIIKKRKSIQAKRKISTFKLLSIMDWNPLALFSRYFR